MNRTIKKKKTPLQQQRKRVEEKRGIERKSNSHCLAWFVTVLIALLLLITAFPAYAQVDIEDKVGNLLGEGDIDGAKRALRGWLLENGEAGEFPSILEHYLSLETDISVIREFFSRMLELIESNVHRVIIWKKKAILEELSGSIDMAQEAYQRAADLSPPNEKALYLLDSARLLFEQGFNQKAGETLSQIFLISDNDEVTSRAMLLRSYIYIESGEFGRARKVLLAILETPKMDSVYPPVLLALVFLNRENPENYASFLAALESDFPHSPEHALALEIVGKGSEVSFLFTPKRYLKSFTEQESDETVVVAEKKSENDKEAADDTAIKRKVFVQTGSFLDRENAEYMVLDLKKAGMRADIMVYKKADKTYHRVMILGLESMEQAQEALLKLKNIGFEGYITFGDF